MLYRSTDRSYKPLVFGGRKHDSVPYFTLTLSDDLQTNRQTAESDGSTPVVLRKSRHQTRSFGQFH